jgi:uncharacterized surface protein with fasciclin (FAS1) repeats
MKNIIAAILTLGVLSSVSVAHCGSCGTEKHTDEKLTDTAVKTASNQAPKSIIETADAAGSFETLLAAVKAAGLVDALSGEGPFTVFAPNDAAFAELPKGTIEALLTDKQALANILTYHVIAGAVKAEQVVTLKTAETLNGQSITITTTNDAKVMVDNANVIATDIICSNGIIHVIDAVILPN